MFLTRSFRRLVQKGRPTVGPNKLRFRPRLEALEDRWLPSVFVVTTTADDGLGSLRQAILDSNATPGPNTIDFDIAGGGVHMIKVGSITGSPLPAITNAVLIDGYSQPGTQPNSLPRGDNAVLLVQLDGSLLTSGHGLTILTGGVTIQGLVVDNFPNIGIEVNGAQATGNLIAGNFVGIDPTGTVSMSNHWSGISIDNAASGNTVGGITPAARNISSGNGNNGVGIYGAGGGNLVEGNFLGTDLTGTVAIANSWAGVTVHVSSGNVIGGTTQGAGNLISGNMGRGVDLWGDATSGNLVEGNFIGTDVTGTTAIGNHWEGVAANGTGGNIIGGSMPGAGNVISGNLLAGVGIWDPSSTGNVVEGNLIGTDVTGSVAVGNQGDGVAILTSGNIVGGTTPGAGNVISGNVGDGVGMWSPGTNGNLLEGNRVGTDATGSFAVANQGNGVYIAWSSSNNIIGGTSAAARNIISGNAANGVIVSAPSTSGNVVEGNFIGLSAGGALLGNTGDGVRVEYLASGNTIGGTDAGAANVISGNGSKGVELTGGDSGNVVEGDLIGTDPTGKVAEGNQAGGVSINGQASNNTIGGTTVASRNLISGNNDHGVEIFDAGTSANVVEGNFLGTDVTGTVALGNTLDGVGIFLGASNNTVGGSTTASRNLISGNGADGVEIYGSGTTGNVVAANFVGTDVRGKRAIGNTLDGVGIHSGASDNKIGGYGPGSRNVISGNQRNGVTLYDSGTSDNVVEDNYIGVNVSGTAALGNAFEGVLITGGASGNTVGTMIPAGRNVISGNLVDGVGISGPGTATNAVAGNYIGTNAAGTAALGNGGDGIFLGASASGNVIGGNTPGTRNVISGNAHDGIIIRDVGTAGNGIGANYIGTNAAGTAALGNLLDGVEVMNGASKNVIAGDKPGTRNIISGNGRDGVDLHDSGTSLNVVAGDFIGTDVTGEHALGNGLDGVDVSLSASSNLVGGKDRKDRNVISGNKIFGVAIFTFASHNLVEGNLIGTDQTGTIALGNGEFGVDISDSASHNVIGGTTAATRNLISGNGADGLDITGTHSTGNRVEGNYIGTDVTGTHVLGNAFDGVKIADGASGNTIGGTRAGAGNLISGNGADGVSLNETGTKGNVIQGNRIGTDVTGTTGLGNGGDGVNIQLGGGNLIGGTTAGAANVIAFNARNGVEVIASPNNGIRQNSIFANGGLGIALENGANHNASAPVLTSAVSSSTGTTIQGSLTAAPSTTYTLEFFSNTTCAPDGSGQGAVYLGSLTVTTDASGQATFTATVATVVPTGDFITATATDPTENTSEFSLCQTVL
jgi:hypothetical protein